MERKFRLGDYVTATAGIMEGHDGIIVARNRTAKEGLWYYTVRFPGSGREDMVYDATALKLLSRQVGNRTPLEPGDRVVVAMGPRKGKRLVVESAWREAGYDKVQCRAVDDMWTPHPTARPEIYNDDMLDLAVDPVEPRGSTWKGTPVQSQSFAKGESLVRATAYDIVVESTMNRAQVGVPVAWELQLRKALNTAQVLAVVLANDVRVGVYARPYAMGDDPIAAYRGDRPPLRNAPDAHLLRVLYAFHIDPDRTAPPETILEDVLPDGDLLTEAYS